MTRLVIHTDSAESTGLVGRLLGSLVRVGDVLLLSGDLGAGKTQLVKGVAQGLGVAEPVTSPTFNILLVHEARVPLYHVDLYRLDRPEHLEDIDYFGTLEAGGVVAVEWGDRFAEAAPPDHLGITLHIVGDTERRLDVDPVGPRSDELARELGLAAARLDGVRVEGAAS